MESKKEIKISLGTVICIGIIIFLIIALGLVYYFGIVKNNNNKKIELEQVEKELVSLKIKLSELKKENEQLQNQIKKEDENKIENEYEDKNEYISNAEYYFNGQIIYIDDETKKFSSENPKMSFEFPRSWTVSSRNSKENCMIEIEASQEGLYIDIQAIDEEDLKDKELKDVDLLDYGAEVVEEGEIKVSDYKGYYKEYYFGDSTILTKGKSIIIDTGNNKYYSIFYSISSDSAEHEYSKKEFEEIFEKNKTVLDKVLSSIKF